LSSSRGWLISDLISAMNAIVTGAGGDIGGACARLLSETGANVLVVDADREAAEAVAEEINADRGAVALVEIADVSVASDVRRYVSRATVAWGVVDAVVHAAGLPGPAAEMSEFDEAAFDRVMAVNARGTFLGLKYVLPQMRDGGAIVNVASVSGIVGYPMVAAYVASKHAVIGLTRTAALEGAARGIRVNAICPGPIEGRLMSAAAGGRSTAPEEDPFLKGVPLARYGTPEEVAATISFLLSPGAAFISGATITIDGGLTVSPT
jgi:NAD(P)-dependent dehydrogenase (short-subunit alcohol dehydrogenase family)